MDISAIKKVFQDNNVPLGADDAWQVQKVWVMKHKALERLSAAIRIKWERPEIIRREADEAVILVMASRADKPDVMEWSIGEAKVVPMVDSGRKNNYGKPIMEPSDGAIGNYQITPKQASYVWAMAEKRAKDRVIIKLAGLHGAYSEEEADDFKEGASNARPANDQTTRRDEPQQQAAEKPSYDDLVAEEAKIKEELDGFKTCDEVTSFMTSAAMKERTKDMPKQQYEDIRAHAKARLEALGFQPAKKAG